MKRILLTTLAVCSLGLGVFAQKQTRDKAVYKDFSKHYYSDRILKDLEKPKPEKPKTVYKIDLSGQNLPNQVSLYTKQYYTDPVSQGRTGTCWCFATTSFFESEVYRLAGKKVKLSEAYTVYWEYVERAKLFVQKRGNVHLGEGSETNAVAKIWKLYGIVPEGFYSCTRPGKQFPDHEPLFTEFEHYLKSVKESGAWDEETVVRTVKAILNSHMGEPPTRITVEGKDYSPKMFLTQYLKIQPDDYVDFMSQLDKPYYKKGEYEAPDNWWHSEDYHNVPLNDYMAIIKNAIRKGYTLAIGGDVSEAGMSTYDQVAVVPSFDIPSEYIDEYARQFRFENKTTTDDHALHLVGYYEKDGKDWYLIKDSGSGSRNGKEMGMMFYHEDFVKLKMLSFTVHKDAAKEILAKFQ